MGASKEMKLALDPRTMPPAREVRERIARYIALSGMTVAEFASHAGYSVVALDKFLNGRYSRIASTDLYVRAAATKFMDLNSIELHAAARGRLFTTENCRRIRRYFLRAAEHGEVALLHGPPGTQKTFVLEHLIAERNREKKNDALYVYASVNMRPRALLRRIGMATGAVLSISSNDHLLNSLVRVLRARRVAIVVDEAQHLDVNCLEILRELHDRSACGLVLAGSHHLYENFLRGRQHLEQWLSRIDHRDPLPGLQDDEVAAIAARELGNGQPAKLSGTQIKKLIAMCQVEDIFGRDSHGKPAVRQYLSVRRLVKSIGKLQEQKEAAV